MGYTYYQLDVYIPKYNNVFSVDVAFEALTERFSHPRYNAKLERVSTNNIEIHFGD